MTDPFATPSSTQGGGTRPRLHQLASGLPKPLTRYFDPNPSDPNSDKVEIKTKGRLVILRPVPGTVTMQFNALAKKNQPRVSVDVVVLDGPPITEIVHGQTHETELELDEDQVIHPNGANAKIPAMFMNGAVLLQQLGVRAVGKDAKVDDGGPADTGTPIFGRLGRLPKKGENAPPYALLSYTEEEKALAIEWWTKNNNPFDADDE